MKVSYSRSRPATDLAFALRPAMFCAKFSGRISKIMMACTLEFAEGQLFDRLAGSWGRLHCKLFQPEKRQIGVQGSAFLLDPQS